MKNITKYLYGILAVFLFTTLAACSNSESASPLAANTVEQIDSFTCEEPGQRDDQGRPIPQC
jgi:hypothetical protein